MTNLTNQRQMLFEEYASSLDDLDTAKKAGYKYTDKLRNQARNLRREFVNDISEKLRRNIDKIVPRALNLLTDLAQNIFYSIRYLAKVLSIFFSFYLLHQNLF